MKIYQINTERDHTGVRYQEYSRARIRRIEPSAYDLVYEGALRGLDDTVDLDNATVVSWALEVVFINLNLLSFRPEGFRGRSLSVSDVIVLTGTDGRSAAYYVDREGFREMCFDEKRANSARGESVGWQNPL